MSTEIATWNMIRSKIPTFPSPSSGRGNECLTKTEIQSLGGENLSINGNYSNSECVILDHIEKVTWEYTFSVQPSSLNFAAVGGTQLISITSFKEKKINNIPTGIRVNVGFDSSPSEGWLSSSGTSVTATENTVASQRTGSVNYTQAESGNPARVEVGQSEAVITYDYYFSVDKDYLMWPYNDSSSQSTSITSYKRMLRNGIEIERKNLGVSIGWDVIDTWFSYRLSGDTITAYPNAQNFSNAVKNGRLVITQNESGNKDYLGLVQRNQFN